MLEFLLLLSFILNCYGMNQKVFLSCSNNPAFMVRNNFSTALLSGITYKSKKLELYFWCPIKNYLS
jgi:hypothetical protein